MVISIVPKDYKPLAFYNPPTMGFMLTKVLVLSSPCNPPPPFWGDVRWVKPVLYHLLTAQIGGQYNLAFYEHSMYLQVIST